MHTPPHGRQWRQLLCATAAIVASHQMANGQFYNSGADPQSVRWQSITADSSAQASRLRVLSDTAAWCWSQMALDVLCQESAALGTALHMHPLSVVVHSHAAYSNGLSSWAPRRIEAYAYDHGREVCAAWHRHLMVHEFRHEVQMSRLDSRFTRALHVLFGQQAVGFVAGLCVPKWFLEGDAVWAESLHTIGGRGQSAQFLQQMRALTMSGQTPSFGQAYFGSYARQVPDYYHLGFYTVASVADDFGPDTWTNALANSARRPFTLVPFVRSLRQQTGMRYLAAYNKAMDKLPQQPTANGHHSTALPAHTQYDFAHMACPHAWKDGLLIYLTTPSDLGHFAHLAPDGTMTKICTPAPRNEERFCLHNDTMVWTERHNHARWPNASEERLMARNLTTGKTWRISGRTSLHSPDISPDGQQIAAVETAKNMAHSLVLLMWDGTQRTVLTLPVGMQMYDLAWTDNHHVAAVVVSEQGKSLMLMDTRNAQTTNLTGRPRAYNMSSLAARDGWLYFAADAPAGNLDTDTAMHCSKGLMDQTILRTNNIYALRLPTSSRNEQTEVLQLTQSAWGVDHPMPTDSGLTVCQYGPQGARPHQMAWQTTAPLAQWTWQTTTWDTNTEKQPTPHPTRRQEKMARLQLMPNIHSWGAVAVDADAMTVEPGLSVASQNLLGTAYWQAGVRMGKDHNADKLFATATWDWLWPRVSINAVWGHYDYKQKETMRTAGQTKGSYVVTETELDDRMSRSKLDATATVPLSIARHSWVAGASPLVAVTREHLGAMQYDVTQTLMHETWLGSQVVAVTHTRQSTRENHYTCLTMGLNCHILRRMAERDMTHRLGTSASLKYDMAPWWGNYGKQLYMSASAYLPGVGRHHSIKVTAAYQRKTLGNANANGYYFIGDRIGAPQTLDRKLSTKTTLLRAEYAMPLANPDCNLHPVVFVKRLNLKLLADVGTTGAWVNNRNAKREHRTAIGADLWAETYWFLFPYTINIGVRATYRPAFRNTYAEMLFSFSI